MQGEDTRWPYRNQKMYSILRVALPGDKEKQTLTGDWRSLKSVVTSGSSREKGKCREAFFEASVWRREGFDVGFGLTTDAHWGVHELFDSVT